MLLDDKTVGILVLLGNLTISTLSEEPAECLYKKALNLVRFFINNINMSYLSSQLKVPLIY